MKKSFVVLGVGTIFLTGCSSVTPIKEVSMPVQPPQEQKRIEEKVITTNSMGDIVQNIDALVASKELYTYQLPIANSVITKREVSGYFDVEKTGKISKVEIGMAEVKDEYYFEKGALVFLRTTTKVTAEGKVDTQIREMTFENGKMVKHMKNTQVVTDTSNNASLEEQSITDAATLFEEFEMKKELNG